MDERQRIELQEGALTFARITELQRNPVEGKFDAAHLKEIHQRIFQDFPYHAPGQVREDGPGFYKARMLEGGGRRYHVHYQASQVEANLEKTLKEFGGPDSLRGLDNDRFAARMAKLYGDLDHIHPFNEGNSRTLRAFTSQLAREAGRELDWGASNADAASRDRLYIARDREVTQRHFPGLDQDRAMKTESRAEYEAYVKLVAPTKDATTLQAIIKESIEHGQRKDVSAEANNKSMAAAFANTTPAEAAKQHPELAGAAAAAAAIDKKAEADGLSPEQRAIVAARVRQNIAASIESGNVPTVQIREEKQVNTEQKQGPDLGRER